MRRWWRPSRRWSATPAGSTPSSRAPGGAWPARSRRRRWPTPGPSSTPISSGPCGWWPPRSPVSVSGRAASCSWSSIGGVIGLPFQAYYSASKFALEGWAEALAWGLEPHGVPVTLVEPGNFHTGFTGARRTVPTAPGDPYREASARAIGTMERDEAGGADGAGGDRRGEGTDHGPPTAAPVGRPGRRADRGAGQAAAAQPAVRGGVGLEPGRLRPGVSIVSDVPAGSGGPRRFPQGAFRAPAGACELLLVRHGQSEDAVEGQDFDRFEGHADPPLSALGRTQAQRLAARLVTEHIDAVYVTSLRRTAETAAPVAAATDTYRSGTRPPRDLSGRVGRVGLRAEVRRPRTPGTAARRGGGARGSHPGL